MKALSVRQPWAYWIASGLKLEETRSRATSYRGRLAIHASLRDDYTGAAREAWESYRLGQGLPHEEDEASFDALPRGRVVALVDLTDCRPFEQKHARDAMTQWRPNAWAWRLQDARRVDSVLPVRGQLGIWEIPDSILRELPA